MTARMSRGQDGLTLIELMVAMVLGLLVAAGIITVFSSTSSSNKALDQLARLQEEGRFAVTRLGSDLGMANGQYCTNSGGVAKPGTGGTYLDHLRTPKVYAKNLVGALSDVTTDWGTTSGVAYPAAPTASYSMPSFLFMRGYDCTLTACTPADPHDTVADIPEMGTTVNKRVKGADVITVRYVNPSAGWSIGSIGGSEIATSSSVGTITSITLKPLGNEPPASNFKDGDLAMLADCSSAQIFPASASTSSNAVITPSTDGALAFNDSLPAAQQPQSAPVVFSVNRDLQTVTYYLKVVSVNGDGKAPLTGALMRRVNGGDSTRGGYEDELVRGVERLDFTYGVQDVTGNTSFLTAKQVDDSTACPPSEISAVTSVGCLWRGIKSIQVNLLMDGQQPLYTLGASELQYRYSADTNTGFLAPSGHAVKPSDQGFPDELLRREFTTLVAVRNYVP